MGRRSVNMSATYSDRSRVRAQEAQNVLLGSNKDRHDAITAGTLGLGAVSLTNNNVNNTLTINANNVIASDLNVDNLTLPDNGVLTLGSSTLTHDTPSNILTINASETHVSHFHVRPSNAAARSTSMVALDADGKLFI